MNDHNYTDYSKLDENNPATAYQNSPAVLEGAQRNIMPIADLNVDIHPEVVNVDKEWDFDGAMSGVSEQRFGVKLRFQDLKEER